jgi:hypothetical protein
VRDARVQKFVRNLSNILCAISSNAVAASYHRLWPLDDAAPCYPHKAVVAASSALPHRVAGAQLPRPASPCPDRLLRLLRVLYVGDAVLEDRRRGQ